jgi:nitric oxide reductase NorQ protein
MSTSTSPTLDSSDNRRINSIVSHLAGDFIVSHDEDLLQEFDIIAELEATVPKADPLPDDVTQLSQSVAQHLHQNAFKDVTVTTNDNEELPLVEANQQNAKITDINLVGGRPSGLKPFGEYTPANKESFLTISDDLTILDDIGRDRAEILADNGIYTWEDVLETDTDTIGSLPTFGESIAKDLRAEASAHADLADTIAIESYERALNQPTDDDGRGISYTLEEIKQPPGQPLHPSEHGNFHNWHYLEDIDHPNVPEAPAELKTRDLPNGQTDIEAFCTQLAKGNNPILIGPPGVGKNTLARAAFAETNRPLLTIPLDEDMLTQELMGIHSVNENGVVVFEDGPLPTAVKYGGGIGLDEINAASQGVLKAIHKILEEDGKLYVKGKNEVIEPHPEFYVFATMNPTASGTEPLARALASRFVPIPIDELDETDEADLLDSKLNTNREILDKDTIEGLVTVGNRAREQAEEGWMPYITTRDLENAGHLADAGDDISGAVEMILEGAQQMGISGGQMGELDEDGILDLI